MIFNEFKYLDKLLLGLFYFEFLFDLDFTCIKIYFAGLLDISRDYDLDTKLKFEVSLV